MKWQEVIDNPHLKDLPFKIELNRCGSIEMNPTSNRHAFIQARLAQCGYVEIPSTHTVIEQLLTTDFGVRG